MAHEAGPRATTESELDLDRPAGPAIDRNRRDRLWEASATAIDFARDRDEWRQRVTATQRRSNAAARWNYARFLHGEEAVGGDMTLAT